MGKADDQVQNAGYKTIYDTNTVKVEENVNDGLKNILMLVIVIFVE